MHSLDLWIKTLHILAVISWMAGMLYLPRLFVYHADAQPGSELSQTLKVMERRLLKGIVNPAMIAVWLTGPLLAYRLGYFEVALAAGEAGARHRPFRDSRLSHGIGADLRRGPQPQAGAVLSHPQRGSDRV